MPDKQCVRCRLWFSETFFAINRTVGIRTYRRTQCMACCQTARDKAKNAGQRSLFKARWTLSYHARRFKEKGIITKTSELAERFGWDVRKMARDIDNARVCGYCQLPFRMAFNGMRSPFDITLNVKDPLQPPLYESNTIWICRVCCGAQNALRSMLAARVSFSEL